MEYLVEYLPDRILRRGVMGTILEAQRGLVAGQVSKLQLQQCSMSVLQALATADNGNGLMNALYHRNRIGRGFLPFLSSYLVLVAHG